MLLCNTLHSVGSNMLTVPLYLFHSTIKVTPGVTQLLSVLLKVSVTDVANDLVIKVVELM